MFAGGCATITGLRLKPSDASRQVANEATCIMECHKGFWTLPIESNQEKGHQCQGVVIRVNMNLPPNSFWTVFGFLDLATIGEIGDPKKTTKKQSQNLKFEHLLPGGFYSV